MNPAITDLDRKITYARSCAIRKLKKRFHDRRPVAFQPIPAVTEDGDSIPGYWSAGFLVPTFVDELTEFPGRSFSFAPSTPE
jgi:hypothetical protein